MTKIEGYYNRRYPMPDRPSVGHNLRECEVTLSSTICWLRHVLEDITPEVCDRAKRDLKSFGEATVQTSSIDTCVFGGFEFSISSTCTTEILLREDDNEDNDRVGYIDTKMFDLDLRVTFLQTTAATSVLANVVTHRQFLESILPKHGDASAWLYSHHDFAILDKLLRRYFPSRPKVLGLDPNGWDLL